MNIENQTYYSAEQFATLAEKHFEMVLQYLILALEAASVRSGRWETWKSYLDARKSAEHITDYSDPEYKKAMRKYDRWVLFAHNGSCSSVEMALMSAIHNCMENRFAMQAVMREFLTRDGLVDWCIHNGIATDDYTE